MCYSPLQFFDGMKGCIYHNWDMYLVFDPTVSPHYEVVCS
jgi:hypothetical protein